MPEEKDFRDYILVFPIPNMPPVYVYLSKPPVKLFEVDLYRNFAGRLRNGTHADHMPSAAAVKAYLKRLNPRLTEGQLADMQKMLRLLSSQRKFIRSSVQLMGGEITRLK